MLHHNTVLVTAVAGVMDGAMADGVTVDGVTLTGNAAHMDNACRTPDHASGRGFFVSRLSILCEPEAELVHAKETPPSLLAEFRLNNDHFRSG